MNTSWIGRTAGETLLYLEITLGHWVKGKGQVKGQVLHYLYLHGMVLYDRECRQVQKSRNMVWNWNLP